MKTYVPTSHLKAAMNCTGRKDTRPYLNGVYVEAMLNETRCVGTCGSAAAVLRYTTSNERLFNVIIPNAIVVSAIAMKIAILEIEFRNNFWSIGGIPFAPLDGVYPDYRRIFKTTFSNEAAHYDFELVAKFTKIAKILKIKSQTMVIRQNGQDAAQVQFMGHPEFVGVIAPLRIFTDKRPDTGVMTWGNAL
jgi:DNA polymerase III sliding clamp (beta) subunit (PCNA family)